jgi:hypothetical protein
MSGKEQEPLHRIKEDEELELKILNKDGRSKVARSTRPRGNKRTSSARSEDGSISPLIR